MEDHREVVVLSGVRTAIGKYGGGLASVPPCDLAAAVFREAGAGLPSSRPMSGTPCSAR
jgi:acetyl-CoA acetyltransferase